MSVLNFDRWWLKSKCKGMDPERFMPSTTGSTGHPKEDVDLFRLMCSGCPVQTECLLDAVKMQDLGWRGGLSGSERLRYLTNGKSSWYPVGAVRTHQGWMVGVPREDEEHGTYLASKENRRPGHVRRVA